MNLKDIQTNNMSWNQYITEVTGTREIVKEQKELLLMGGNVIINSQQAQKMNMEELDEGTFKKFKQEIADVRKLWI